jgi:hypothetical protein
MSSTAPVTITLITRTLTPTTPNNWKGKIILSSAFGDRDPASRRRSANQTRPAKDSTDQKNETNGLFVVTRHYEKRSGDLRARGAGLALLPQRILAKAIDVPKSSDSVL